MESEREPTGRTPAQDPERQARPDEAFDEEMDPSGDTSGARELDDPAPTWEDDSDAAHPAGTNTALPPKMEAWRRRSAAGAILTGFALGLQEALEKRKDEPSIVLETSGEPPKDLPVEAEFEYGRPRQSVVQIRPWLLPDSDAATGETAATGGAAAKDASAGDQDRPPESSTPPESNGGR